MGKRLPIRVSVRPTDWSLPAGPLRRLRSTLAMNVTPPIAIMKAPAVASRFAGVPTHLRGIGVDAARHALSPRMCIGKKVRLKPTKRIQKRNLAEPFVHHAAGELGKPVSESRRTAGNSAPPMRT